MIKTLKLPLTIVNIIVISLLTILTPAQSSTPCDNPQRPAIRPNRAWAQNSRVTVNVSSASSQFTQAEFNCINEVFNAYNTQNGASDGNGSGVRFDVKFSQNSLVQVNATGDGIERTALGNTTLGNVYEIVKDDNSAGFDDTGSIGDGTNATAAMSKIDSRINVCEALKETMGHAIAHTLGLDHCQTQEVNGQYVDACFLNGKNSVMATPPCNIPNQCTTAEVNQIYGTPLLPTDCDKSRLIIKYSPATVNQPPPNNDGGGGDGGGENPPYCETITIPGQCYEVCVEWSEESYDPYWGVYIVSIYSDCDNFCDPDQTEEICY